MARGAAPRHSWSSSRGSPEACTPALHLPLPGEGEDLTLHSAKPFPGLEFRVRVSGSGLRSSSQGSPEACMPALHILLPGEGEDLPPHSKRPFSGLGFRV